MPSAEERERVAVQALPVLGQSAAAVQPADGPLDDPALGQDHELADVRTLDDLDIDLSASAAEPPLEFRPLIAIVGVELQQERKHAKQRGHQQHAPVTVLNVRCVDDALHQQALRIDEDVSFLALDLLCGIKPMRVREPPFSALLTLWLSIMPAVGL